VFPEAPEIPMEPILSTAKVLLQRRVVRFLIVGVASSLAYVGTMSLMVDGLGRGIVTGAIAGFVLGTLVSYVGNSLWTFEAAMDGRTFTRFWIVVGAGFVLNLLMASGLALLGVHHLLVSLAILITVPIFNYACHSLWTYRTATG
jgi:putative flippase GtrA